MAKRPRPVSADKKKPIEPIEPLAPVQSKSSGALNVIVRHYAADGSVRA